MAEKRPERVPEEFRRWCRAQVARIQARVGVRVGTKPKGHASGQGPRYRWE